MLAGCQAKERRGALVRFFEIGRIEVISAGTLLHTPWMFEWDGDEKEWDRKGAGEILLPLSIFRRISRARQGEDMQLAVEDDFGWRVNVFHRDRKPFDPAKGEPRKEVPLVRRGRQVYRKPFTPSVLADLNIALPRDMIARPRR